MTIHKPTEKEIEAFTGFLLAADMALKKHTFSLNSPEENWKDLDEDDEDKLLILKIRKEIAEELGCRKVEDVDDRILMYEFLKIKTAKVRSIMLFDTCLRTLIDNVCDPTEDHLAFYPGFELFHVAKEM